MIRPVWELRLTPDFSVLIVMYHHYIEGSDVLMEYFEECDSIELDYEASSLIVNGNTVMQICDSATHQPIPEYILRLWNE